MFFSAISTYTIAGGPNLDKNIESAKSAVFLLVKLNARRDLTCAPKHRRNGAEGNTG